MGFVEQSNTKKIYAYLTQLARKNILDGNEADITVKYFSLHDNDVNYNISANIVNNSYNTLPSGFIPDITGDNQGCLFSIANGIGLSNFLGGVSEPPIVVNPEPEPEPMFTDIIVEASCEINLNGSGGLQFRTGNFIMSIFDKFYTSASTDYTYYVVTDIITFPNADPASIPTTLSSITSSTYTSQQFLGLEIILNATFKFSDNGYLPRVADAYNFTLYVRDNLGNIGKVKEFKDINCSKREYGAVPYTLKKLKELSTEYTSDYLVDLIPQSELKTIVGGVTLVSANKVGFALFVVDNGNRRRDLNLNSDDLDIEFIFNQQQEINFNTQFRCVLPETPSEFFYIPFDTSDPTFDSNLYFNDPIPNVGYHSTSIITEGAIVSEASVGSALAVFNGPIGAWAEWNTPLNYSDTLVPDNIFYLPNTTTRNPLYTPYKGDWDALHPTVIPFDNMGLKGFTISYVEITLKNKDQTNNQYLSYKFGNEGAFLDDIYRVVNPIPYQKIPRSILGRSPVVDQNENTDDFLYVEFKIY